MWREIMMKAGRLKVQLLKMTWFFFCLPLPCTYKDQRLSICSSCPFLHGRLQGLRGLCSKWSQTGLSFTGAYRQREIQRAWEVQNHTCSHHCTLTFCSTHAGLRLPDSFPYQSVRLSVCEPSPPIQKTTFLILAPPGYKVMASFRVGVVCELSR